VFGSYDISNFEISGENYFLRIKDEGSLKVYERDVNGSKLEKLVASSDGKVLVNPVEPVNLPKNITNYLMIAFKRSVILEPKVSRKIFVAFPVEVAVILAGKKSLEVVDIFSFSKPKFALYGDPRRGVICRYWESDIYGERVSFDYRVEGLLEVELQNSSDEWVELRKIVLDVYGMKIYYGEDVVAFARVNVLSESVAETEFVSKRLDSYKKSLELYTARKIPIIKKKFVMELGL